MFRHITKYEREICNVSICNVAVHQSSVSTVTFRYLSTFLGGQSHTYQNLYGRKFEAVDNQIPKPFSLALWLDISKKSSTVSPDGPAVDRPQEYFAVRVILQKKLIELLQEQIKLDYISRSVEQNVNYISHYNGASSSLYVAPSTYILQLSSVKDSLRLGICHILHVSELVVAASWIFYRRMQLRSHGKGKTHVKTS